jgi:acyl-CoA dehydrogenase
MPFAEMRVNADMLGLADGPTEVHLTTLAREVLKNYAPGDPHFPSYHLPTRRAAAQTQVQQLMDHYAARL